MCQNTSKKTHCFIWLRLCDRDHIRSLVGSECSSPGSKNFDLQPLLKCPFIALTVTTTRDIRGTIFESHLYNNPHMVFQSPNKANVSYVDYTSIKKNSSLSLPVITSEAIIASEVSFLIFLE